MQPIVRSTEHTSTRIMRPSEWEELREAMDPDMRRTCTAHLLTGMRYAELRRLRESPEWFDGNFVNIPANSIRKQLARQRERSIKLSDAGRVLVPELFEVPEPLPNLRAFDMFLLRLSRKIIGEKGIHNKSFRKTWESWLVFYYPNHALHIALSQGHTTAIQYAHYINLPFTDEDRKAMRKWVEGWA